MPQSLPQRHQSGARCSSTTRATFLLALFAVQSLSWFASLTHGSSDVGPDRDILSILKDAVNAAERQQRTLDLDELDLDSLPGDAGSRKLMGAVLGGPLPGLTFVPGFPGGGGVLPGTLTPGSVGLLGRMGALPVRAAAEAAFATYVVQGQDPVAIALRQLSIVAIQAYGTALQNSIKRGVAAIDAQLKRYAAFLKREAKALASADAQDQLAVVQRRIRALVIARAALKDIGNREVANVKFLTSAVSAWVSWFYGIQYRFSTLTINLNWQNDPIQLELNRVLYSLGDVTSLVGLLLQPFIKAFKFEQSFFASLYNIIFAAYQNDRNRLTFTPVITMTEPLGSGKNLQAIIQHVTELAKKIGSGANAEALLTAATAARDQVAQALNVTTAGRRRPESQIEALEKLAQMLRNRAASKG